MFSKIKSIIIKFRIDIKIIQIICNFNLPFGLISKIPKEMKYLFDSIKTVIVNNKKVQTALKLILSGVVTVALGLVTSAIWESIKPPPPEPPPEPPSSETTGTTSTTFNPPLEPLTDTDPEGVVIPKEYDSSDEIDDVPQNYEYINNAVPLPREIENLGLFPKVSGFNLFPFPA
jgi:hypothetical protein